MPQLQLLNHAAWVNKERSERRYNAEGKGKGSPRHSAPTDEETFAGKRISDLTSEEYAAYHGIDMVGAVKAIDTKKADGSS
jgi:hypothetical protein